MTASDKCYQMALNLNLIARKISYNDVQIAANYLSQCANNILTV